MDLRTGGIELTEPLVADAPTEDEAPPERKSLRSDSLWNGAATGMKMITSIITFWMLSRFLGKADYGIYSAALALLLITGAVVTVGTQYVVMQRVSREPSMAAEAWGAALLPAIVLSTIAAVLLAGMANLAVPGIDARSLFTLALAEFWWLAVGMTTTNGLAALDRFKLGSIAATFWSLLRVSAVALAFFVFHEPSLPAVGMAFLVATVIGSVPPVVMLHRLIGRPHFSIASSVSACRAGWPFSLTSASGIILGDIDKQMLLRFASQGELATGTYSAGNRFVGLAAAPVYAVLGATFPRFFAAGGEGGVEATWKFAKRLLPYLALYAVAAGVGLFVIAPLVPYVLGSEYADSVDVIRIMALVPIIHLPGLMVGEVLTGAGFQNTRNLFILAAGGLNITLNLVAIPMYEINGAIVATYASEIFLLAGYLIWIRKRLTTKGDTVEGTEAAAPD